MRSVNVFDTLPYTGKELNIMYKVIEDAAVSREPVDMDKLLSVLKPKDFRYLFTTPKGPVFVVACIKYYFSNNPSRPLLKLSLEKDCLGEWELVGCTDEIVDITDTSIIYLNIGHPGGKWNE